MPIQKSSKEDELDLIFAEEFCCDGGFVDRYVGLIRKRFKALGAFPNFKVEEVTAQPHLKEGGFGDLFVFGSSQNGATGLLIEHKITAGPALRQAERYKSHAEHLRKEGWMVLTVLVAPKAYSGESELYDCRLDLESAIEIIESPVEKRREYRRGRLLRAIEKKNASGVQIHDQTVFDLHSAYRDVFVGYCDAETVHLKLPPQKQKYYDGDSWIERIKHPHLPEGVEIRHRLWLSVGNEHGQVDLIVRNPDESLRERFATNRPNWASFSSFSKSGIQISAKVPALKAHAIFDPER